MKKFVLFILAISFSITNYSQLKINQSGNVGIGYEIPQEKLHINGSIKGNQPAGALKLQTDYGYSTIGAQNTSCIHFMTDLPQFYFNKKINIADGRITSYTNFDLILCTGSNFYPRVYLKYDCGYVGIGDSDPDYKLDVYGDIASYGNVISSDERIKSEIKPLETSIDKIMDLEPIEFKFKPKDIIEVAANDTSSIIGKDLDYKFYDRQRIGFSAQNVQELYPQLVATGKDGLLSVDYLGFIPVLVNAIKEQQLKIEELEKEVAKLSKTK